MKKFTTYFKIFVLTFTALFTLCSCQAVMDAVSSAAESVASSAQAEISSVLEDGMESLTEGLDDIKNAASSISSAVASATDLVSDEVGGVLSSVSEEIASDISGALASASDEIASGISDAVEGATDGLISVTTADTTVAKSTTTVDTTVPATTEKDTKWYTFRNKTRYDEHYEKHGSEFGNITKAEYLQLANDLINSTSDRVLHKYSEDGDYMYFDQDTGYFLVLSEDGYIRTFFIPSAGINYWNRQ